MLAQAALFVVLRDQDSLPSSSGTSWTSLTSRRFCGDQYRRNIKFQTEDLEGATSVDVTQTAPNLYEVVVNMRDGSINFSSAAAHLLNQRTLTTTMDNIRRQTTIVSQSPLPGVPASQSPSTMEKLHVFSGGRRTTLVLPPPIWVLSLGGDVTAAKGALKAPMPSLIVEVKVRVGDSVVKGQVVVIIESMKTETVLRAEVAGLVKTVGCKNGEMVEEGRELVEIEAEKS